MEISKLVRKQTFGIALGFMPKGINFKSIHVKITALFFEGLFVFHSLMEGRENNKLKVTLATIFKE